MTNERGVPQRALLWAWLSSALEILIPERRGDGWLKCPLGHHFEPWAVELETLLRCDLCGLDGTLSVECGMEIATYPQRRRELEAVCLPIVARQFQCAIGHEVSFSEICKLMGYGGDE